VAVKLTSPGPALYRGARVGRGERVFHIFKFRTMKVGSEQRIGKRLVRADEDHYTPIGRFLRKYRLDELAQLFNVLRGDMNLVGPRPMRPIFLDELKRTVPGYAKRFTVRPGITGLAQVRGGYYTHPRHKLFYDVLYIANRSVWMDVQLVVLTFLRVMTRIFTTGFLLAWLVLMALVLPPEVQQQFILRVAKVELNVLYFVPSLIAVWHVVRREVTDGRLYAFKTPVDLPLLGFVLVTAMLIPFSRFPWISLRGLVWYLCNGIVVFYIVLNSSLVRDRRDVLVNTLVGATAMVGVIAIGQMLQTAHSTGELVRLVGTIGNPLLLAGLVVIVAPLAVARLRRAQTPRRRALFFGLLALLLATGVLTFSRSGILALAIGLGIYVARHKRRWVLGIGGAWLAFTIAMSLFGDTRLHPRQAVADLQRRVEVQLQVLDHLTATRLLVGTGARTLPSHVHATDTRDGVPEDLRGPRTLENTYLTVLADHGVAGLVFFLAFLFGGLAFMFRSVRRITDPAATDDVLATAAGITAFAFLMLFSDALYRFPLMLMFWAAMGFGIGTALTHLPGPRTYYRLVHYRHHL
jgi:lipopolysaccharide/colanic/teichoic acid biosynthesis glycosyltransferase